MKSFRLATAVAVVTIAAVASAFAQSPPATTTVTTVSLDPFIAAVQPYIQTFAVTIVTVIAAWLGKLIKDKWGIETDLLHSQSVQMAATNAAGQVLAKIGGSLQGRTINVRDPLIAQAANEAIARIPDAAAHFGLTTDAMATKITAKLGLVLAGAPPDDLAPAAIPLAVKPKA